MDNSAYLGGYSPSLKFLLREFVLHLKHTFGEIVQYVGTTTELKTPLKRIRDMDIMVVFSVLNESNIIYVWKIINKLHSKYNLILDVRIYSNDQLLEIPLINKYLLSIFLNDQLGENPFNNFTTSLDKLREQCFKRIKEQENKIIATMPRIAGEPSQIRDIAQSVYDAIRACLILENHPIASKEEACSYFSTAYPKFSEASAIYDGYLSPNSIIDVAGFIIDSLALVKHLFYKAQNKPLSKNILLINTPSSIMPHPRDDYLSYDHNMPLGLVCVASYLEDKGFSVEILDAYAENIGVLSTVDRIFAKETIPEIIGLNTSSPNIHIVHRISSYLRRIRQDIKIICGGPHASLATEHTLSTGDIDYAIVGEGEISFSKLVQVLFEHQIGKASSIPGVFTNVSGRVTGKKGQEISDLSTIPLPNFNALPLNRYFAIKKRIYIHTSRGCAFNCIYCSVPKCWGKQVREIPTNILIDQLSELLNDYGPKEIQIVDDNFSHKNGKLIKTFCEGILERGLKFRWKCQVRADQLNVEIVEIMAKSGCFEADMGIESGNKEIQRYIRKNLNLQKTLEVISLLSSHKIFAKAFLMLGFPEESYSQIADTINYAIELKKNGLNDVAFFPVMPFPGTEISQITGKVVFQGAIIDDIDIYERSFSAHRLRKYSAKPEISLNSRFAPEELRLLVKFAYQHFNFGTPVEDQKKEFQEYLLTEESHTYGV